MADWWDWLANASYQTLIEGTSYRERLSPHRALLNRNQGGIYIGGAEKVINSSTLVAAWCGGAVRLPPCGWPAW